MSEASPSRAPPELERFQSITPPARSALRPPARRERLVGAFDPVECRVVESRDEDLVARGIEGLSADGADADSLHGSYFFE